MVMHSLRSWIVLASVAAAAGCADEKEEARLPISHSDAALTVQKNAKQALEGAIDAGGFLAESLSLAQSLSQLGGSAEDCGASYSTYVDPDCTSDLEDCETTTVIEETCSTESSEVTVDDLAESRQELRDAVDEFIQRLQDEVFTEANLESDTGSEVVYRLGADLLCSDTSDDPLATPTSSRDTTNPAVTTTAEEDTVDPECEATVSKLEPRLRLTSPSEGDIDVALLLTSRKSNPVTLEFYDDRLGIVLDLNELRSLLEAADEMPEGMDALEGKVSLELVKNAERDYSLRGSVLEDLLLTAGDEGEKVTIKVGRSSPTAELRMDGNARTITGTYDMATLGIAAPLDMFRDDEAYDEDVVPTTPYSGIVSLLLGGINGSLTFDGSTDVLRFVGLGLGDVSTTVHHDGDLIFKLDVNPDHDRRFDLQVQSSTEGSPVLTFSPTLDVRAELAFQKLTAQIPDLDPFLLNDTVRLWFEGASPSVRALDDSLRVESGTLHLESQSAPESSVTVTAGMCLAENDAATEPVASLSAAFTAEVCE